MIAPRPIRPYKYFAFFEESDSDIFFGRRAEIEILLADIVTTRLVVLFARSGTGKSSLINAGIRPRLRDRDYKTLIARLDTDPVAAVAQAASSQGLPSPPPTLSFAELLTGIVKLSKRPLVLFLDQFEEFFLNDITDDTRRSFIADVGQLYRTKDAGVHLVFSMREDYLAELDAFRDEIPAIFEKESQLRLRLLTEAQARDAIEGPSKVVAVPFDYDEGLVERIVADLPREHALIQPVAVQIVCDTLWEEKKSASKITHRMYESLLKAKGIIDARVAQDIAAHLDADQILMLESAIDLMHTKDWTKRPVSESELLAKTGASPGAIGPFMNALDKSGLARIDQRAAHGSDVRFEWVSDYISERSKEMPPNLRRIWLAKVRQATTPVAVSRERTTQLLDDAAFLGMLDVEEWYFLLRAASATRDALGQWRLALEASRKDPWPVIDRALNDPAVSEENAARLMQYLGEASGGPPVDILAGQLTKPARIRTALRALGTVRDPKAIVAIKPFLEQEEWQIAALDALRTIATSEAIGLADSVQKRGKSFADFFSRTSELRGMSEDEWGMFGLGVVGLIGPGLSAESTLKRLTERFEYPFAEPSDIRVVMEYLSVTFGSGWQKLLTEETADISSDYLALATLPFHSWLTTDYTDELERALTSMGKNSDIGTPQGWTKSPSHAITVFHLLGYTGVPSTISELPRPIALSRSIREAPLKVEAERLIVFGFDPSDAEVALIRGQLRSNATLMIVPPPQLDNRHQLGRAQEYFHQCARTRGVHFYFGMPEEFVTEYQKRFTKA